MSEEFFDGTLPVGMPVYFYPNGRVENTQDAPPVIAFCNRGWSLGISDLTTLPAQDGSIITQDHVFHVGDPRTRDAFGNLSPGAQNRGVWDFMPWSKAFLDQEQLKPAPKKKASPAKS